MTECIYCTISHNIIVINISASVQAQYADKALPSKVEKRMTETKFSKVSFINHEGRIVSVESLFEDGFNISLKELFTEWDAEDNSKYLNVRV